MPPLTLWLSHFALCPPYLPQTLPRLARAPPPLHPYPIIRSMGPPPPPFLLTASSDTLAFSLRLMPSLDSFYYSLPREPCPPPLSISLSHTPAVPSGCTRACLKHEREPGKQLVHCCTRLATVERSRERIDQKRQQQKNLLQHRQRRPAAQGMVFFGWEGWRACDWLAD